MSRKAMLVISVIALTMILSLTVSAASDGWVTADVESGSIKYYGKGLTNWRKINAGEAISGSEIYSDRDLHTAEFSFEGTAIRYIASVGPNRGTALVYVDDVLVAEVDLYSEEMEYQKVVYEQKLDLGMHTIKVVPTGKKSENATFAAITVNAFQYLPSLTNKIAEAYGLLRMAPTAAEVEQNLVSFNYPDEAIEALVVALSQAVEANKNYAPGEDGQIAALVSLDQAMKNFVASKIIVPRPSLYSFEGNLNDSLGAFNALTGNELTYVDGKVGKAVYLDGNVYFQLPADHPIATSEQMTVAAWVNWKEGNTWQRIVDFGNNTSQYFFITPNSGNGTLRFAITSGKGEKIIETKALPKNEWVHVAVTLGNGVAKLYVNGELAASGEITIVPNDFQPKNNYVGKSQWPDPLFNGLIDELYINNVVLSEEEIKSLM